MYCQSYYLQLLDPRILFAITYTFNHGNLIILGTNENDVIQLHLLKDQTNATNKRIGLSFGTSDQPFSINSDELKTIRIDAKEGDDTVWIDSAIEPFTGNNVVAPITILGGEGNDDLTCISTFPSRVVGGAGNDHIESNNTVFGGDGDDDIFWSSLPGEKYRFRSAINAGNGNDTVYALSYSPRQSIDLGAGNDTVDAWGKIDAGEGDDLYKPTYPHHNAIVHLGKGNDSAILPEYSSNLNTIYGDEGDDSIIGDFSSANLAIYGGTGNDTLGGGSGNDYLDGGDGEDRVSPRGGADTVMASDGYKDWINKKESSDTYNLDKKDTVSPGVQFSFNTGSLRITGRLAYEYITITSGFRSSYSNGHAYSYEVYYFSDSNFDFRTNSATSPPVFTIAKSRLKSVTIDLQNGSGNVQIEDTHFAASVTMLGGNGDDIFVNNSPTNACYMNGGDGNDSLVDGTYSVGGAGNDSISNRNYHPEGSFMDGGDGGDRFFIRAAGTTVIAGKGDDRIFPEISNFIETKNYDVMIDAGEGNDQIIDMNAGSPVNLKIHMGSGNDSVGISDSIIAENAHVAIYGDQGNDTINLAYSDFTGILDGGSGNDGLSGSNGNMRLSGQSGTDYILGGNGDDTIFGGTGNDTLEGGAGHDLIYGNEGADRISTVDDPYVEYPNPDIYVTDTIYADASDEINKEPVDIVRM